MLLHHFNIAYSLKDTALATAFGWAAARALSVNHATISRRIQALESSVGEKLVERRPEGYVLTAAGMRTMEVGCDMEAAVGTLGRGGADNSLKGLVRVNAPPALAHAFLIAELAKLPTMYTGLDIDIATDLRMISLECRQADIAIRLRRPIDGDFIAKLLGRMAFGFYGTPEVCQMVEAGSEPTLVSFDEENSDMAESVWLARHYPRARISFRANNQVAQAIAAKSGAGLALLPHYIGRREPDLQLCQLSSVPPPREIWLLTRSQDRKNLPVRTVTDHLIQTFSDVQGLFEV